MGYTFSIIILPFLLSLGAVGLLWYVVDDLRESQYWIPLVGFTAAAILWSGAVMFQISATAISTEVVWHNVRIIGAATAAVSYFLFTAIYTNRDVWVRRERIVGVLIIPIVTVGVAMTSPAHSLLRADVVSSGGSRIVLSFEPGIWYGVHAVYSYLLVAVGTGWVLLLALQQHSDSYFQYHTATILLSAGVVMGLNLAYNLDVTTIDWTPVAGGIWASVSSIAVTKYRLFDLTPVARKTVVEDMETGMIVINTDQEVIDANPAATKVLQSGSEIDLIGRQITTIFPEVCDHIPDTTAPDGSNTCVVSVDGEYYDVKISTVTDSTAELLGYGITFVEATERVEQQRELEEKTEQLEAKTAQLETQNTQLERFTSVVTHDLRNPIGVSQGFLRILREESDLNTEHADEIEDALNQMERLIDDLLELAKAGDVVDDPNELEFATTARNAWSGVDMEECTLTVTDDAEIDMKADASRLLQVLQNLYRNARVHNTEPVSITVGLIRDDATPIGIYVEDDGCGIPPHKQDQVFEHGYTNADDGTGFGLSIVSDIVDAHGWDISVTESAAGGARFEIVGVEFVE